MARFNARMHGLRTNIDVGSRSRVHPLANLALERGGEITLGSRSYIHRGAVLSSHGGSIRLGSDCTVNPYSVLYGHGGLTIGNFVRIAAHCVIVPMNHRFDRLDIPISQQGITSKGVVIEDDVWIGTHAVVLDGVTIGHGAVIGAGAIVTKNVAPYSICVGNPAHCIATRQLADEN